MAKVLVNRAKVLTSTTGTGVITLGTAIAGFQTFSDAGVQNGDVVRYVIEDGEYWELGTGTYTASGTTLTRNVVESSNSDNAINLSGDALVFVTADASDYVQIDGDVMTGDLTVTNIITSGNVDGRDVSVDGAKLDAIEANATADQTKADIDALNINADTLDGQHGSYYTNYTDTAVGNMAATFTVFEYTATAGQTVFSGSDENGNTMAFVAINTMVTMNGIILDPSDYTVTSTTTITLDVAAVVNDVLNVIAFTSFTTADTATSAQGDTADAALPKAGGAMTGAITTNSTFDGRDVATDGTKLDGIETGATADQTASEIRALVESASDSNVFTDADHTKLNAIEASADVTDTANVVAALIAGTNITIAANGTITSTDTNTTYSIQDGELSQNNFTNADHSKLDGIEAGATADQTAAEIKVAYESNSDTNEFSDAEQTKLSNIEANATADQTAAEIKTLVGSATDSNVFTDADHTKLDGIETAATADQTKADIEGLGIDVPATNLTGTIPAARLSTATTQAESDDSTKIATTAYVVDKITTLIGGAPSTLNDLNELAAAINDDANYNTTLTTALATKLPLAGGTLTGDLSFGDSDKAIFGAGSDLQIYHDGFHSYIRDNANGVLRIQGSSNVQIEGANEENMAVFNEDEGVFLYYDAGLKLATTSTGIQVTGNIANASGDLTIDVVGQIILDADNAGSIKLQDGGTFYGQFFESGNSFYIGSKVSDGDMIFQGNDGGSTITALTLDMSNAGAATFNSTVTNKGAIFNYNTAMYTQDSSISSYAANNGLYVNGNSAGYLALRGDGSGKQNITLYGDTSGVNAIYMYTNSALTLRLDANGDFYTTPRANGHAVFNEDGVDADFRVESNNNENMLFVDAGNDRVQFGSNVNIENNIVQVTAPKGLVAGIPQGQLGVNDSTAMAQGVGGAIDFTGQYHTNGAYTSFASVEGYKTLSNNGNYDGTLVLKARAHGGDQVDKLRLSSSEAVFNESGLDTNFRVESDGNANMLFVDGGNNRVGIGTSSPSAGLELNLASGDGLLINSADISTIKMKANGGGVKNWGFAHTNLLAGDFGIYASNSNGGDPITAGAAKLYFNSSGNATFSGTVAATSYTGDGSNLTGVGGSTAYGAVGTYIVGRSTSTSTMAAGSTRAGSGIRSMGHSWRNFGGNLTEGTGNNTAGGNLSGTWRIMGDTSTGLAGSHYPGGIWVRIS